jgi:hypothetical protein
MSSEGQSSQQGLQGMYVLKDSAGCSVYRPTWQGTRTVIRPFPGRNPEAPQEWDPFRLSDEPRDFGDWIRRYDMAHSLGNPGITFVIKDPMNKTIDDQQNPVWMLYRAINQAIKAGSGLASWNPLIFGAAGRSAPLTPPKDGFLLQGVLMEHKSKMSMKGSKMEDRPIVMLLSQSAGNALLEKLEERDVNGELVYGDATDLDAGYFIQFHQAGTQNRAAAAGPSRSLASVGGGSAAENMRYEVEFLDVWNSVAPNFDTVADLANAHVKLWDNIVRIPTIEEQVGLICNAGIPASAVVYALGDVYGEYIPQAVHDKARAEANGGGPVVGAVNTRTPAPGTTTIAGGRRTPPPAPVAPPAEVAEETGSVTPAEIAEAVATPTPEVPFDAQPTHADGARTRATADALERARRRARQ